ncbi:hypothetical protein [Nocardia yunnanensis]|nr:hypothetical protein [Nocardia yunnanensis]
MSTNAVETLRYTKIETTADGGSAFVDGRIELSVREVATGVIPQAVGELASGGALFVRSGEFDSAPHTAPARQWVVMLRGSVEVTVTSGEKRVFAPGDLLLAADVDGLGHRTATLGDPPFEALYIAAPEEASAPAVPE